MHIPVGTDVYLTSAPDSAKGAHYDRARKKIYPTYKLFGHTWRGDLAWLKMYNKNGDLGPRFYYVPSNCFIATKLMDKKLEDYL